MMAEHKFFEAQKLIEVQLKLNTLNRHELLVFLNECYRQQNKNLPDELVLELAEKELQGKSFSSALALIGDINHKKFFNRVMKIKIEAAVANGLMEELYQLLSGYFIHQFENQIPWVPDWVIQFCDKFFSQDFNLMLKKLSLKVLVEDIIGAENLLKQLIIASFEKSSQKGLKTKLNVIQEVIRAGSKKAQLEIYQSFCGISCSGIQEKADLKKLVEMVIYFDDFKFQVLVLDLLEKLGLVEEAQSYSVVVRNHKEYKFIYFDKFFPELKKYFVQKQHTQIKSTPQISNVDLALEDETPRAELPISDSPELSEDEEQFLHLLKYQSFSPAQLCDLSVGFLQSEMPRAGLLAAQRAIDLSVLDTEVLKASYLKLTCLLKLNDFRGAIDTTLEALNKASSKDDILSFLYGQADAYLKLNQKKKAKAVLIKILKIDSRYRLAQERLDKINEI
jgi:hypothetical protein